MESAYLDESGDLGSKGSRNLVLTLMCTRKKKEISKIIRDAKKRLLNHNKSARWLNRLGEIKFYSFPDKDLLKRTIKKLADVELAIYYMVSEKDGIKIGNDVKQTILAQLFDHIIKQPNKQIGKITADLNFFNREKVNRFALRNYAVKPITLKNDKGVEIDTESREITFSKLSDEEYMKLRGDPTNTVIEIEHSNSRLSEELQALDLISGSIFAFFENKNREYLTLLETGKAKITGINLNFSKLLKETNKK